MSENKKSNKQKKKQKKKKKQKPHTTKKITVLGEEISPIIENRDRVSEEKRGGRISSHCKKARPSLRNGAEREHKEKRIKTTIRGNP